MAAQPENQSCLYQQLLGVGPGFSYGFGMCLLLEINRDSHKFMKILYRALAMLYHKDPWKRFRPEHLVGLHVGEDSDWSSKKQLFSCARFLGSNGSHFGLYLFKSEQDALNCLPASNVEILRVIFENENLLDALYKAMLTSLGLEPSGTNQYPIIDVACSSSNGGEVGFRDPTMEELRYLVGFIRAITALCSHIHLHTDKETMSSRNMKPFRTRVNVMWPAELASIVEPVEIIISHPPNQINRVEKLKSKLIRRFRQRFYIRPGLGPSSGTCPLNVEGISDTFIKGLYRLLATLYYKYPWKDLLPGHNLGLHVDRHSDVSKKKQIFPCAQFTGANGGNLGLHLFKSEQDALKFSLPVETKLEPNVEILRVTFEKEDQLDATNKRMVAALGLEPSGTNQYPIIDVACGTSNGGEIRFRDPTMEELSYLTAVIKAITLIYPSSHDKDKVTRSDGNMELKPFIRTVVVVWPDDLATVMDSASVTVSHPPNQIYGENKIKIPIKDIEPPKEDEELVERAMCEKAIQCEQSICCGQCMSIIYCGRECQTNHWIAVHKEECSLYKSIKEGEEAELAMKIFKFNMVADNSCEWLESMGLHQKGMWRRVCGCYSNCPFGLLPAECKSTSDLWAGLRDREYPANRPAEIYKMGKPIFLFDWSEYYNIRSLSMRSRVAALLSHPLTVYYILTNVTSSKSRLIRGKEVIVHYLGPEVELDWMQSFTEISHLLDGLAIVKIFMVGPEVPKNVQGPVSGLGRWLRVYLYRGLYQEQIKNLPSPHLVIALNCEMESYDSWSGALEVIKSMGVPVYFSERSKILFTSAIQILRTVGFRPAHGENPFRSPLQERMPPNNMPCFRNGFLIGVNG